MPASRILARLLTILALLLLLTTLTAWFGSINPNPQEYRYPDEDDLAANYDAHVGGRAQVSGTVVATDPVQIRISNGVEERWMENLLGFLFPGSRCIPSAAN